MRTNSKLVLLTLLLGLLLACAAGRRCQARPVHHGQTNGARHHPLRVRFRHSRKDHPVRRPFAPGSSAAIPPDEDDDENNKTESELPGIHPSLTTPRIGAVSLQSIRVFSRFQRIPDQPLYQTLCILLI
ncbi:MAG TPA: hypothetical protein VN688_18700 [Gemmataceae bacterium]|nr:hypothetical protein [Gemmataceae bacterium]